jgi:predicted RND superfamily exporter protein
LDPVHIPGHGAQGALASVFRVVIRWRWPILVFYLLLCAPAAYFAISVKQDNALDRLIVPSDPDLQGARAFEKVFGAGEYVVVLAEAKDPYAPEVLGRLLDMERAIAKVEHVTVNSALSSYLRAHPDFQANAESAAAFRKFAEGTDLFRKQGLVGDGYLGMPLVLDVHKPEERNQAIVDIDAALSPFEKSLPPLTAIRKVGEPYVTAYLDTDTKQAGMRYFPLFFLFVIVLNVLLYRSWRALCAFLLTLGVSVALTQGFIGLTHGVTSIVSALVPMTVLVTCMSTLVYLHSRFVDRPPEVDVDEHQIFALTNKFLACTASIFATAVGFAALVISDIRPIREMGVWVAVGLSFTWVVVFTLFPALQRILRTPTSSERKVAGQWFDRVTAWLPLFSYRFRWVLVPGALVLSALGAVSLFGIPHLLASMRLETSAVYNLDHKSALYHDTIHLEKVVHGLAVTEMWLTATGDKATGAVTDTDVLRALDQLQLNIEQKGDVGAAIGPTTILRTLSYVMNGSDKLPTTDEGLEQSASVIETRLNEEPMLKRFFDPSLSNTHITIISQTGDYKSVEALEARLRAIFEETKKTAPALGRFQLRIVGKGPLQAKIAYSLVPTLTQSFVLTIGVIFFAFLLIFRNGAARLMAMIPSLFAILVMFGIMRLLGVALNVATILIASTVLGTSENDQIHFFYHFLEGQKLNGDRPSTEVALRHTLRIAGRAIFFATLINAGGFLAFALANLKPIQEFGLLSSLAFVLSMIADFTALPAALWFVFRDKPDCLKQADAKASDGASAPPR